MIDVSGNQVYLRVKEWGTTQLGNRWYTLVADGIEQPNAHVVILINYPGDRPSEFMDGDRFNIVKVILDGAADGADISLVLEEDSDAA